MSRKKMAKEIREYIHDRLQKSDVIRKRVTFRRSSQVHEDSKQMKSKKARKKSKQDIRKERWRDE